MPQRGCAAGPPLPAREYLTALTRQHGAPRGCGRPRGAHLRGARLTARPRERARAPPPWALRPRWPISGVEFTLGARGPSWGCPPGRRCESRRADSTRAEYFLHMAAVDKVVGGGRRARRIDKAPSWSSRRRVRLSAFCILESHARLGADAAPADAALGACLSRVKDHAPRLLRAEATTVRLQGRPSQLASPIA